MGFLSASNKNKQIIIVDDDDHDVQSESSSRARIVDGPNAQSGSSSMGPVVSDPIAQSWSLTRSGQVMFPELYSRSGPVIRDPSNVQSGSIVRGSNVIDPNVPFGSSLSRAMNSGYESNFQVGSSSREPISQGTIQFGSYQSNFQLLEEPVIHESNVLFGSSSSSSRGPIAHESTSIQLGSSSLQPIPYLSNFPIGSSSRGPFGHESNFQFGSSSVGPINHDQDSINMNNRNGLANAPDNNPLFPDVDCTLRLGLGVSSGCSSAKSVPNTNNRHLTGPTRPQRRQNNLGAVNNGAPVPTQFLNRWGVNYNFRYDAAERMNNVEFHGNFGMLHGRPQMPPMMRNPRGLGPEFPFPQQQPALLPPGPPLPPPPRPFYMQNPSDILGLVNMNIASGALANPCNNRPGHPHYLKKCLACQTTKTPLWRNGPTGPKTLCNACGIRYKKEAKKLANSFSRQLGFN